MSDQTTLVYQDVLPDVAAFIKFRADCGWGELDKATATDSLSNSLYSVCCLDQERLVGFGRLIGDGVLYFYIQDLIVDQPARGQGVGYEICQRLILWAKAQAHKGAIIGLLSAKGKEGFYQKLGFIERPNAQFGAGMIIEL